MKKISVFSGLLLIVLVMEANVYGDEANDKLGFKCWTSVGINTGNSILIDDSHVWYSSGNIFSRQPGTNCNAVGSPPYLIMSLLKVDTINRSSWKDIRKMPFLGIINESFATEKEAKALEDLLMSQIDNQVNLISVEKVGINTYEIFYVLKDDLSNPKVINFMDFLADIFLNHKSWSFYFSLINNNSDDFTGNELVSLNIPIDNIKWVNPKNFSIPIQGFETITVPSSFLIKKPLGQYPSILKRKLEEPSMIGIKNSDLMVYYAIK